MKPNPEVDAYIAGFPPKVRALMKSVRAAIIKALPDGEERFSYGMAGYFRDGAVAYFAAFKAHFGFFPPARDPGLRRAAAKYAGGRGNLKFLLTTLPPYDLIAKLVKARAAENRKQVAAKHATKKASAATPAKKKLLKKRAAKKKR